MSESSLSSLSDFDFTNTPRRSGKHARCSTSPTSERPSKIVKLVYRKPSKAKSDRNYTSARQQTSSPTQPSNPNMTLISKLEVQHLHENNGFLRRSNVELAKANAHGKAQVQAFQEALNTAREEKSEAQVEMERLKKENELLASMVQQGAAFDPAATVKRMAQLEEYRRVYWECGVEWARRENAWNVEKELFKKEVGELVEKVGVLEGEVAEERAKVRGFEGEMLERQREMSMRSSMMPDSGRGTMITGSENGGGHDMRSSWQNQQVLKIEPGEEHMQNDWPQQWQGNGSAERDQEGGHSMMLGRQSHQYPGSFAGQSPIRGHGQQQMLPMMTMQEQFQAHQPRQRAQSMMPQGQFDGLGQGDEDFTSMLEESAMDGNDGDGGLAEGLAAGRALLSLSMGTTLQEFNHGNNDMDDWEFSVEEV